MRLKAVKRISIFMLWLSLLWLHFCSAEDDPIEMVEEMLNQFETITANTADVLTHASIASKGLYPFLKLAVPVASLALGSLKISDKKTTPQYIALMKLNSKMTSEFERIVRVIQFSRAVIRLESAIKEYINTVRVPFHEQRRQLFLFWNSSLDKDDADVEELRRICMTPPTNPKWILDYIYEHVVAGCSDFGTDDIAQLVLLQSTITNILVNKTLQKSQKEFLGIEEQESAIRIDFMKLSILDRAKALETINSTIITSPGIRFDTAIEAIESIDEVIKEIAADQQASPESKTSSCLVRDVITGRNFMFQPFSQFLNMLRLDIGNLCIFASLCANATNPRNPQRMEGYIRDVETAANKTLFIVRKWGPAQLEYSWPMQEEQAIKDAISRMDLPIPINRTGIDMVLTNISRVVKSMGHPKYTRQIVVTTAKTLDADLHFVCSSTRWCHFIPNHGGLHVISTRFLLSDEDRIWTAWQNMSTFESKIVDTIKLNYNIELVSNLYNAIEAAIGSKLVNFDLYNSALLIRDTTSSSGSCNVKKIAGKNDFDIDYLLWGDYDIYYYYPGTIARWCESYMLLFLA